MLSVKTRGKWEIVYTGMMILWNTPVVLHSCGAGGLVVVTVGEQVLGGLDGSVLGNGNYGQVVDRCRSICLKGVNSFKQSVVGASATLAR